MLLENDNSLLLVSKENTLSRAMTTIKIVHNTTIEYLSIIVKFHDIFHSLAEIKAKEYFEKSSNYNRGSNSLATTLATANMYENIRIMNISQYTFDKNLSFLL